MIAPPLRGHDGQGGRTLPHDLEAEQSVLGSLMLSPDAVATVRDLLDPSDFYVERHAHIFRAATELSDRGEPIDPVTLRDQLERQGVLTRAGGIEYVAELSVVVPTAANVRHYADIVVEHATRRRLIAAGTDVAALGFDDTLTAQEATDRAEQRVFAIGDQRHTTEAVHIAPLIKDQWAQLEALLGNRRFITGVPTNFSELDNVTQGLQRGELIILAARPSVGKTSFALNVARNAAVLGRHAVAVFSLEMSKESLVQRLLCSEAHVDSFLLKTGQADASVFSRIAQAMDRLTQADLWIDDTPALSISAMRARARRMKAQHDIRLVVVDYLQLMHGGRQESRVQEVSDISAGLKSIAKELNLPVLALSQLSRESERRTDRRPQLSDLRDSGCLAADTPIFLPDSGEYRPIALVQPGERVQAIDVRTWRAEPRVVTAAFTTGVQQLHRLTTVSGSTIRATGNHPFLAIDGWRRLDELAPGDHIATPRLLPSASVGTLNDDALALLGHLIGDGCVLPHHVVQYTTSDRPLADLVVGLAKRTFGDAITPRVSSERSWLQVYLPSTLPLTHGRSNPIAMWFRDLGIFGLRAYEKRVPAAVFAQSRDGVATFLRHLWATDGCIHLGASRNPAVQYATSSHVLAAGVKSLLLRFGITAAIRTVSQRNRDGSSKGRDINYVVISGADVRTFLAEIGPLRPSAVTAAAAIASLAMTANTNRDVIPAQVWRSMALPAAAGRGMSHRDVQAAMGTVYNGSARYKANLSRPQAERVATATGSAELAALATSDVYWDRVASIAPDGVEEVWDLTVDGLPNFVAGDIFVHNSIEQDADIVLFLYREGMHNPEKDKSETQLLVAKNRNGPIRDIDLVFVAEQTAFREPYRGRGES